MKSSMKISSVLLITTLTLSSQALANDTVDKLKGLLGNTSSTQTSQAEASGASDSLDIASLVSMVSDNLGVSEEQSQGGVASIFDYAKENLSSGEYTELASNLPGLDSLMDYVPEVSADSSSNSSAVSGLLNKASEYSSSLSSINELKKQFEALGLDADMISSFVTQINAYLSGDSDTQALLQSGLGKLTSLL
ncbi:MAG: DUF2780 domain-containing protein [Paraglaciecola chathamensis]|jgi:hypothetical protein|uniref:DUF2780 domain-containing protein n=1 Tax=Paraglaciecola agarilytica NO2 TaxID=1125747 RepID=A0ABQ0I2K3_9ALTE|nr:DUF2780 domain-containing protein [Paraglaciecola agarilytica]AEE21775.1 hypothetical protein Glaag_0812 [Glaciecola sp. 4H-3-7+YE-5]GAC03551.1 hypothetical protein GAGA_0688 [Paraglaciecola agarilytica NO2]